MPTKHTFFKTKQSACGNEPQPRGGFGFIFVFVFHYISYLLIYIYIYIYIFPINPGSGLVILGLARGGYDPALDVPLRDLWRESLLGVEPPPGGGRRQAGWAADGIMSYVYVYIYVYMYEYIYI